MLSYQYRESHCGDQTVLRLSYLHDGISFTGKMTSLYWIRALSFATINSSPLDKMAIISQTTDSNAFSWMKKSVYWLEFHWKLFPRVQLIIIQHWFRCMVSNHDLNKYWHNSLTHICGTRMRWVNNIWWAGVVILGLYIHICMYKYMYGYIIKTCA